MILSSAACAIARLEAQISKDWNAYQERPRRKFIGARTQEYRFARYVEDWRQKIERIGELNYPQAAREQRVFGTLVATVSIRSNGSLERVQIDRSSGYKLLDEATVRIVTMAAPYSAFPEDIARDTDVLHITRPGRLPGQTSSSVSERSVVSDRYAVIGNPIGHSKSPQIHAAFARQTGQNIAYDRLLAPLDGFEVAVRASVKAGTGLMSRSPFKREAWDIVDRCEGSALAAEAV